MLKIYTHIHAMSPCVHDHTLIHAIYMYEHIFTHTHSLAILHFQENWTKMTELKRVKRTHTHTHTPYITSSFPTRTHTDHIPHIYKQGSKFIDYLPYEEQNKRKEKAPGA